VWVQSLQDRRYRKAVMDLLKKRKHFPGKQR